MKSRKHILLCTGVAASFILLQPLPAQTPPPPPETTGQGGTAAGDAEAGSQQQDSGKTGKKRPRGRPPAGGPPQPAGDAPPELDVTPSGDEGGSESILDEIDDFGPAGDLAPSYPLFDQLTIDFNKAVAECDLKKFLEVRERYIAEIRRILSNPNLERRARAHFERVLKAVEETMVPIRAPLPCPLLIR